MDTELKKLLEETRDLARENNEMLHRIRRVQKRAQLFRAFYWVIVIGVAFGAYYYIQPYLQKIASLYNTGNSSFQSLQNISNSFPDISHFQDFLKQIQNKQ